MEELNHIFYPRIDLQGRKLPCNFSHFKFTDREKKLLFFGTTANVVFQLEVKELWSKREITVSKSCSTAKVSRCDLNCCYQCTKKTNLKTANVDRTIMFTCKCGWLLFDPCTLACGHTLCRSCIEDTGFCLICGSALPANLCTNIFLADLLAKWFPREYKAACLKKDGHKLLKDKEYQKAVTSFSNALMLTPNDHVALLSRSEARLNLGQSREALDDSQLVVKLKPTCGLAFFRLGAALTAVGQLDQAINAYQTCLELEPDDISLFKAVVDNLDKSLAPPDTSATQIGSVESSLGSGDRESSEENNPSSTCSSSAAHTSPLIMPGIGNGISDLLDEQPTTCFTEPCSSNSTSPDKSDSSVDQCEARRKCNVLTEMDGGCCSSTELNDTSSSNESSESTSESNDSGSDEDGIVQATSKRFRTSSPQSPGSPVPSSKRPRKSKDVDRELDVEDFECKLCFNILFQPVTTPCGHIFCKACLDRCLDHKAVCPNCRASLEGYLVNKKRVVTEIVEKTLEKYFPLDYREMKEKYEKRMAGLARVGIDEDIEVPIFICTMVLPTMQCPLHIFEPRYRFMLRECMDSGSQKFGICMDTGHEGFSDVGTIVEVHSVQYLNDGRAIIDAVGSRRFTVVSRGGRDGIDTARVKYFDDVWPENSTREETVDINSRYLLVYRQLSNYVTNLHPTERECIFNALGPLPLLDPCPREYPNGVSWIWWALAALPLNNRSKETLLRSQSVSERLTSIQRFLCFLMRMNKHSTRPSDAQSSGNSSAGTTALNSNTGAAS